MSKRLIVLGDSTSHGGAVIEASGASFVGGVPYARVGDKVTCPHKGHGTNTIVSGDPTLVIDGKPAAREGDKTACGAVLVASQSPATS